MSAQRLRRLRSALIEVAGAGGAVWRVCDNGDHQVGITRPVWLTVQLGPGIFGRTSGLEPDVTGLKAGFVLPSMDDIALNTLFGKHHHLPQALMADVLRELANVDTMTCE